MGSSIRQTDLRQQDDGVLQPAALDDAAQVLQDARVALPHPTSAQASNPTDRKTTCIACNAMHPSSTEYNLACHNTLVLIAVTSVRGNKPTELDSRADVKSLLQGEQTGCTSLWVTRTHCVQARQQEHCS